MKQIKVGNQINQPNQATDLSNQIEQSSFHCWIMMF